MKLEVNVKKKYFFIILGVIFIFLGLLAVYAFGTDNPSVFGHSPSEIGPGSFTNFTDDDSWDFPGDVVVGGLEGAGNRMVIVDQSGKLIAQDFPSPDTDIAIVDEFIGKEMDPWSKDIDPSPSAFITPTISEFNHPGILRLNAASGHAFLYFNDAISALQMFDVSFTIRTAYASGFAGMTGEGFTVGLFDGTARVLGVDYLAGPKIVFEVLEKDYTSPGNWLAVTAQSSTRPSGATITDTGAALPSANKWVTLRIQRVDDSTINFYVDGILKAVHTTTIPISDSMKVGILVPIRHVDIDRFKLRISEVDRRSVTCDPSPIFDTLSFGGGVSSALGYLTVNVPNECIANGLGCVIKQEIYDSRGIKYTRMYNYKQEAIGSGPDSWVGSLVPGKTYFNGDSVSTNIVPSYADSRILLRDDYTDIHGGETSRTLWVSRDSSTFYGQKIYVCTYS